MVRSITPSLEARGGDRKNLNDYVFIILESNNPKHFVLCESEVKYFF